MKKHRLLALIIVGTLVAASCGGSSTTDSEYGAVVAERDATLNDLAAAEQALVSSESDVEALTAEVESLTEGSERLESEVDASAAVAADAGARADAAIAEAADAREETEALKVRFDPEIRAALESEIAAEIVRACGQAKEEYDRSVSTIVGWSEGWASVTTREALIAEVDECSAAERSKGEEQRESDRLAACESVDVDALEKNPDKYRGECIHMWVLVVQYDSATGICTFRGEMASRKTSRWYEYDGNAMFSGSTDPVCPELDDIDNDDFVEMWASGNGTLSYDTTAGGTATATVWRIEKIELWRKD
jgi:hypothetical protein